MKGQLKSRSSLCSDPATRDLVSFISRPWGCLRPKGLSLVVARVRPYSATMGNCAPKEAVGSEEVVSPKSPINSSAEPHGGSTTSAMESVRNASKRGEILGVMAKMWPYERP